MYIPIVSGIVEIAKGWMSGYQKKQKAKQDLKLAELENKARLMRATENNNHTWEMANLADKDKWLRRYSLFFFSAPFIVGIFAPEHVQLYFDGLVGIVPLWWQKTFMAMMGGVWGISSLKNVIPSIVDVFKKK